jgi:Flp pilus assembly pilin Flp
MDLFIKNLIAEEAGATMLEYAILIAFIGGALAAALTTLKTAVGGKFTSVTTTLNGS